MMNLPTHIAHISDLHIGSSADRSAEYRVQFDKLAAAIPLTDMVVITGDIFHHKVKYSGEDVDDFNYLITALCPRQIVIIPGNHDANLSSGTADLITPLVRMHGTNVHYIKDSGPRVIAGTAFYHISVFDPVLPADPPAKGSILLYHGMVDGAHFGASAGQSRGVFTVSGKLITAECLARFHMVLLGDIHEHQFVAPNAAYAGSLIQQNVAESRDKGWIRWDIAQGRGVFMRLPNDTGFVKLDLRRMSPEAAAGAIAEYTPPGNTIKVSIVTDADDTDANNIIDLARAKLGKVDRVLRAPAAAITPTADILATMEAILRRENTPEDQTAAIIMRHREQIQDYEHTIWRVLTLGWSNLFRYGPDNYIDFGKLEGGISGVIAPNCSGKSSIIDVIIFALYGEHLRGEKKDMMRHGAATSRVCIEILVNADKYKIMREDRPTHQTMRIYRAAEEEWTNVTPPSIREAYQYVIGLIGHPDHLLATGIYYNAARDIVHLTKCERMHVMAELLGLSDNKKISTQLDRDRKQVRARLTALPKPRADYDPAATERANARRKELLAKRAELTARLAECMARQNAARLIAAGPTSADLDAVTARLRGAKAELAAAPADVGPPIVAPPACASAEDRAAVEYAAKLPRMDELIDAIAALGPIISAAPAASLANLIQADNAAAKALEGVEPPTGPPMNPAHIQAELNEINDALIGLPAPISVVPQLVFDPDCTCCAQNRRAMIDAPNEIAYKRAELMRRRTETTAHLAAANKAVRAETLIAARASAAAELAAARNASAARAKMTTLNADLARVRAATAAAGRISAAAAYDKYQAHCRRADLESIVAAVIAESADIAAKINAADQARTELTTLAATCSALSIEIAAVDREIGAVDGIMPRLTADDAIAREYAEQCPVLTAEFDTLDKYYRCINSPEFRAGVIARHMDRVINRTNEILHHMAPLSLSAVASGRDLDLYYTEIGADTGDVAQLNRTDRMLINMASGFQSFVISIAFRLALTASLYAAPDFIFIDEGFGCIDAANTPRVIDMFHAVKNMYKFVFIISHIPDMQAAIDIPLRITIGEYSHITNGALDCRPITPAPVAAPIEEGKIMCTCGRVIKRTSLRIHMTTATHKKLCGGNV